MPEPKDQYFGWNRKGTTPVRVSTPITLPYLGPSDETLNRGALALLLRKQYEFPFGINIVQFSIFNIFSQIGSDSIEITFFQRVRWNFTCVLCILVIDI